MGSVELRVPTAVRLRARFTDRAWAVAFCFRWRAFVIPPGLPCCGLSLCDAIEQLELDGLLNFVLRRGGVVLHLSTAAAL